MGSVVVKGRHDSAASTNVTAAGTNTAAGYVTVARTSSAQEECPSTTQAQSIQRLATPLKMKLLVDRSLVHCNRM